MLSFAKQMPQEAAGPAPPPATDASQAEPHLLALDDAGGTAPAPAMEAPQAGCSSLTTDEDGGTARAGGAELMGGADD